MVALLEVDALSIAQEVGQTIPLSRSLLRQGVDVKFGFMAKHRGIWPVNLMCDALGVSRSGFYAWLPRPPSQRSQDDEVLGERVRQSFMASDRTYGARRVWRDVLALGFRCGQHRIERLMRVQGLRARPRRLGVPKDAGARSAIAGNVLDRQFQADGPDRNGWPTLPIYGRPKAGCMSPPFSTCILDASLIGRCRAA